MKNTCRWPHEGSSPVNTVYGKTFSFLWKFLLFKSITEKLKSIYRLQNFFLILYIHRIHYFFKLNSTLCLIFWFRKAKSTKQKLLQNKRTYKNRTSCKSCRMLGLKGPRSSIKRSFLESVVTGFSLSFWFLGSSLVSPVLFFQYTRNLLRFCC